MDEDAWSKKLHRGVAVAAERLLELGWTVLAAAAAILAVHLHAGAAPGWLVAVALLGVAAVAAFAPQGAGDRRRAGEAPGIAGETLDHLAAADLAAAVPDPLL